MFTRIFRGASSIAKARPIETVAPFVAVYAEQNGKPTSAIVDAKNTIELSGRR